jgi:hypothetical protein
VRKKAREGDICQKWIKKKTLKIVKEQPVLILGELLS